MSLQHCPPVPSTRPIAARGVQQRAIAPCPLTAKVTLFDHTRPLRSVAAPQHSAASIITAAFGWTEGWPPALSPWPPLLCHLPCPQRGESQPKAPVLLPGRGEMRFVVWGSGHQ